MASGGNAARFPAAWYDGAPVWVLAARKDIGTREKVQGKSNPAVLAYFAACGHGWVDDAVGTPWCAAFYGAKAAAGGLPTTKSLMARSYLKWGTKTSSPQIGDAAVFWRGKCDDGVTGHIGIFIRRDSRYVYILSGNNGDQVGEERIPVRRLLGYRRPPAAVPDVPQPPLPPPDIGPVVPPAPAPKAKKAPPVTPVTSAWTTTVIRELQPESRKVSVLVRLKQALQGLIASIAGLFTLDNFGVAKTTIEQAHDLVKDNAVLIIAAGAVLGIALVLYLLSCIAEDYKSGNYRPSGKAASAEPPLEPAAG